MFKLIKYWLPVCLWAGLIFYLSGVPSLSSGLSVFYDVFLRKLAHAGEFVILVFLIFRALYFGQKIDFKKALIWSLILAVLYAFSDEFHQYFVPGREARLRDMGVDSLGVVFFGMITLFVYRIHKRKKLM